MKIPRKVRIRLFPLPKTNLVSTSKFAVAPVSPPMRQLLVDPCTSTLSVFRHAFGVDDRCDARASFRSLPDSMARG
jgi:hypothetical protein